MTGEMINREFGLYKAIGTRGAGEVVGVAGRESRRGEEGFHDQRSRAGGVVGGVVAVLLRMIGGGI
ncbi:MAG TPA: hypothetical protein PKJ93_02600 [Methanoculleus sp.]|nr:hypothetical protein [Methanoculleus sp.]